MIDEDIMPVVRYLGRYNFPFSFCFGKNNAIHLINSLMCQDIVYRISTHFIAYMYAFSESHFPPLSLILLTLVS